MENGYFRLGFDKEKGGISSLVLACDPTKMNFCREGKALFCLKGFEVVSVCIGEETAVVISSVQGVKATTSYSFEQERMSVAITVCNENAFPVYYKEGDLALEVPFFDAYEGSDVCMRGRCHTHIWAGLDHSYIRLERMGDSEHNLGVWFEKGRFSSYSQEECKRNSRGVFLLNASPFVLQAGEQYEIQFTVFSHSGGEDFFEQAKNLGSYLRVLSKRYTVEENEKIEFTVESAHEIKKASCKVGGNEISCKVDGNKAVFSFPANRVGEVEARFSVDDREGKAVFNVTPDFDSFIKRRLYFIVDKQQCLDKNSPLYGAYLIYDNEEQRQYFDFYFWDHNACRERMGMVLCILKYLQKNDDEKLAKSVQLFNEFYLRECVDEDTGVCYGNIGKDQSYIRLYNAPWVALYYTELYNWTGEVRWAKLVARILLTYYGIGGATRFYPNGLRWYTFYQALQKAGLYEECKRLCAFFKQHADNIAKNGVLYPPHEVNFEQTIVTPAVSLLLDEYFISGDKYYLSEAEKHLRILRRFDGMQPHYRMNTVPIRYWDDCFFGKTGTYGDVFPHYWSTLSGYCYYLYYEATGNERYLEHAQRCIKNTFCNIRADGSATCAYVFPAWVHAFTKLQKGDDETRRMRAQRGAFEDAFANDQDFALYFFMKMQDELQNKETVK